MKNNKNLQFWLINSLMIITIILIFLGIFSQFKSDTYRGYSAAPLLFFTTQSNLLLAFVLTFQLGFRLKGKGLPPWLEVLRFISAISVFITYVVFALFLSPFIEEASYFYSVSNLTLHTLAPLFGIFLFLLIPPEREVNVWYGLTSGIYYLLFTFLVHGLGFEFGPYRFPYFFLNYELYGWFRIGNDSFGVFYWLLIVASIIIGLSFTLRTFARIQTKQKQTAFIILGCFLFVSLSLISSLILINS